MKNPAVLESLTYQPGIRDGVLYHYTSADSLFEILGNLKFRCSSVKNLNDLYDFNVCNLDVPKDFYNLNKTKQNIKLLCFTKNYRQNGNIHRGTNLPRMWAQYADNNRGACIAIDKHKFIQENSDVLKGLFYKIKQVRYTCQDFMISDIPVTGSCKNFNSKSYLEENHSQLFFSKHIDWRDEREVRFLGLDTPNFLSIKNSVKFISLGNRFCRDKELLNKLAFTIAQSEILQKFYERRMFLFSVPTCHGYKDGDAASFIKEVADTSSQTLSFFKKEY